MMKLSSPMRIKKVFLAMLIILGLIGCRARIQIGSGAWNYEIGSSETPQPTYTSIPTFTPRPTYTANPTYTPKPTYTPNPTYTPLVEQTAPVGMPPVQGVHENNGFRE